MAEIDAGTPAVGSGITVPGAETTSSDSGTVDTKPKVNIGPDGKELKEGDEGYLYAGKYKTVGDMEKGIKEGEQKITELGQAKSTSTAAISELRSRMVKAREGSKADTEADKLARRQALATRLKASWEKDPLTALGFLEELIESKHSDSRVVDEAGRKKKADIDTESAKEYDRVRGTDVEGKEEQQKEFDKLKPAMKEIWSKMPKEAKVSGMIETVYLAAKAQDAPNTRAKLLADIKAGTSQPGGGPSPEDKRTEDDKILDKIVDQSKKDHIKL